MGRISDRASELPAALGKNIRFRRPTRNQLVAKYYRYTVPGGSRYDSVSPAVYRKPL